jgi:hypothetical protein
MEPVTGPSKGLGDDIAKITHATGIDVLAKKLANLFGKEDCGCEERKELLNNLVPYKKDTDEKTEQ